MCSIKKKFVNQSFLPVSLTVAGLFLMAGCATVGKDFPASQVTALQIGKTTRDEVREIFGAPWRTGIEDGRRTWTYGKYKYSLFAPARTQDLVIRFNDEGRVVSYTFNTTEHQE